MLEESYTNELNDLASKWSSIFQEFNDKATRVVEQLIEKQETEMKNCIEYFETAYPIIKFSSKLLDLRIKEENLVKQERYELFNKIYRSPSNSARN
jgi:hypothetical protein